MSDEVKGTEDIADPRPHLDRFVAAYRKAGGMAEMIIEFVHTQIR